AGICLLQEVLGVAGLAIVALLLWKPAYRIVSSSRLARIILLVGVCFGEVASAMILFLGVASPRSAEVFLSLSAILLVVLLSVVKRTSRRRTLQDRAISRDAEDDSTWSAVTTLSLLLALLAPFLGLGYLAKSWLGELHPVALLLGSLIGESHTARPAASLGVAAMAVGVPLGIVVLGAVRALSRSLPAAPGAYLAIKRLTLPAITCLMAVYLLMLTRTLRQDVQTSRAINLAAQNDLRWVLTHSPVGDTGG
ncbi:MAG TPA: hypothetical protein VGS41_12320, partial [Chthonomonadales bacterium]|nr:hypothetical protein [Chthonomonadales bacterium]